MPSYWYPLIRLRRARPFWYASPAPERAEAPSSDAIRPLLLEAVRAAGATIVTEIFHNFSPHGVSGVIVIAESHVAIHTWPEHTYAAVDIFSCSATLDQVAMGKDIAAALGAARMESRVIERGVRV